ncbi:CB068 protein, partial [Amia calva]|nr:CB068 protein [Amia calva]
MEVLREEDASVGADFDQQNKYKPGGRLDMSHGFLHHIRRNQIARDDYDKEVKQAKERQKRRHTNTPSRPRRPDIQVYHPRRRSGSEQCAGMENEESNESSSGTEPEAQGTELFCLEYEADGGRVSSFIVYKVRWNGGSLKLAHDTVTPWQFETRKPEIPVSTI